MRWSQKLIIIGCVMLLVGKIGGCVTNHHTSMPPGYTLVTNGHGGYAAQPDGLPNCQLMGSSFRWLCIEYTWQFYEYRTNRDANVWKEDKSK